MFHPQQSLNIIDSEKRKVHSLLTSINQPTVAFADHPAAPAFAFIFGVWNEYDDAIECMIMLYQPKKDVGLFYTHENGPVPEAEYLDLETEAIQFTDSMGFMMDNLNYADQSLATQLEMAHNFPPFMPNRKLYQAARAPSFISNPQPAATDFVDLDAEAEVVYNGQPSETTMASFERHDDALVFDEIASQPIPRETIKEPPSSSAKEAVDLTQLAKLWVSF